MVADVELVRDAGVWVNILDILELRSFPLVPLDVMGNPSAGNCGLSSLPTLNEDSCPDNDTDGVDGIDWSIESLPSFENVTIFLKELNSLIDEDDQTENRGNDEHARVVDKPREIESEFLSIVLGNEVDWLHVLPEVAKHHRVC